MSHDPRLFVLRREFPQVDPSGAFTVDDYLHACGRASDALLYAALFCPDLTELDGSVLLSRSVETQAEKDKFVSDRRSSGRHAAETSYNFVEIPYIFGSRRDELSDEGDRVLAEIVAASWRAWLPARYPGRRFVVQLLEPDRTGSVIGLHFCEDTTAKE